MKHYNNKQNHTAIKIIFMLAQILVLAVVYIFLYTSFLTVNFAIEKHDVSFVMYFPIVMVLIIFPILLYKYRQMFNSGKMLISVIWMMGTASLTIVLLYVYISQLIR